MLKLLKQKIGKRFMELLDYEIKHIEYCLNNAHESTLFLKRLDILDEKGYIIVDQKFRTKYDLVYACGDVIEKDAYQIATSTGDGVSCAIDVINILNKG